MDNKDIEFCKCDNDFNCHYTCTLTGKYCEKVSQHMQEWTDSIAYIADNKINSVICTASSNLCADVKCDLYKRVRDLHRQNVKYLTDGALDWCPVFYY